MRTIKERLAFNQTSTLLVACPEYCNGGTSKFNIWPQVVHTHTPLGNSARVQVILLNCTGKDAIVEHVKGIVEDLKREPQELEVMQTILFFEKTLKKIGEEQTAPLYNSLRTCAERIVGPFYAADQNALCVQLDSKIDFPPIL